MTVLTKRGKERLLKLADALEKISKKHFDLDVITKRDHNYISDPENPNNGMSDKDFVDTLKEIGKGKKFECKTAACAVGWCPSVFPRTFKWNEEGDVVNKKTGREDDIYIVNDFFSINSDQADYLFLPGEYHTSEEKLQYDEAMWGRNKEPKISKKRVIKRIRKFVENDGQIIK